MNEQDRVWDAIEDLRTGMLTTEGASGLESRPMSASVDRANGSLWFITRIDSSKTQEIADDAHVNVSFAGSSKWVSLTGTARVVRDPAKARELWSPFAEAWMPEGPDAPTTALIHVNASHATLWDEPGKLAQLVNVAVANITQKPPTSGDEVRVTL